MVTTSSQMRKGYNNCNAISPMKRFLLIAKDSSSKRLMNSWVKPGPKHRRLPESCAPEKLGSNVFSMPHTKEALPYVRTAKDSRGDGLTVMLVEKDNLSLVDLLDYAEVFETS
jgi:hypothetical protein